MELVLLLVLPLLSPVLLFALLLLWRESSWRKASQTKQTPMLV